MHVFCCLLCSQSGPIEPFSRTQTVLSVVVQFQHFFSLCRCILTSVQGSPQMRIQSACIFYQCFGFDNLKISRFLKPQIAHHIGRSGQQARRFFCLILFYEALHYQHGSFFHGDIHILRHCKHVEKEFQGILFRGIQRCGARQQCVEKLFHVFFGKQAQFAQLAVLSFINKVSRMELCSAERASVVTLYGESTFRNQVSARQNSSFRCLFVPKNIGKECNQVVGKRFVGWHLPTFYQGRPVKVNLHHFVDD